MASVSLIVAGEQRITGETIPVRNPYTLEPVAEVSAATPEVLKGAVDSAEEASRVMRSLPTYRRAEILNGIANRIRGHAEELSRLLTMEGGKPIRFSRLEVDRASLTFSLAAEEARRISGEILSLDVVPGAERRTGIVRRFPVGVVLGISPFNFPLNLVAHKVAPAIAAGNSIIIKPASATPLSALRLGEIALDAGLPPGALNVTPCRGSAAEAMLADERVKKLTFTGSAAVGWHLKSLASKKKVTLELGGNAGVILEDAKNLESVVQRLIVGSFAHAGQVCISVQRIFVNWKIYADFEEMFVAGARSTCFGDPTEDRTIVGPMIDTAAADRTMSLIERARDQGARVLCGGQRERNIIAPTILAEAPPDSEVCAEEVFAPVVTIEPYDDFEDALRRINASRYGLQAGVWTTDIVKAMHAFEQIEVGGVIINDYPMFRVDSMPYGGVKDSGFGREGVRYAIEEMTEPRLMVLNLSGV